MGYGEGAGSRAVARGARPSGHTRKRSAMMEASSLEENAALDRLRSRLLSSGEFSNAAGRQMLAAYGGVDLCLLRFLRAQRGLDVRAAHAKLSATLAFREQNGVGMPETMAAAHRDGVGDWWCGTFAGRTQNGCPVTYWRFRCIEVEQLQQRFDEEQLKRFYIAWMERGLALQREVVAERIAGCPGNVDIYDLEGVGWRQLSSGARLLSGVLSVAQDHYPENLKQAIVVNAPATFTAAWRVISAVVDKKTQEKFVIRRDGAEQVLETLLGGRSRRAAVWSHGDLHLGGGTGNVVTHDNVVALRASGGWRHVETITVPVVAATTAGATDDDMLDGRAQQRLVWRFDVEEAASLTLSVHFTPAGTDAGRGSRRAGPIGAGTDRTGTEVRPTEVHQGGPGRGSIAEPLPGQYQLIWQAEPPRIRSRMIQLRLRCWLQRAEDHPLGALSMSEPRNGDSAPTPGSTTAPRARGIVPRRHWLFHLGVLVGVGVGVLIALSLFFVHDARGAKRWRLVWAWVRGQLVGLRRIAGRLSGTPDSSVARPV